MCVIIHALKACLRLGNCDTLGGRWDVSVATGRKMVGGSDMHYSTWAFMKSEDFVSKIIAFNLHRVVKVQQKSTFVRGQ